VPCPVRHASRLVSICTCFWNLVELETVCSNVSPHSEHDSTAWSLSNRPCRKRHKTVKKVWRHPLAVNLKPSAVFKKTILSVAYLELRDTAFRIPYVYSERYCTTEFKIELPKAKASVCLVTVPLTCQPARRRYSMQAELPRVIQLSTDN
jgi:hypothetical protein